LRQAAQILLLDSLFSCEILYLKEGKLKMTKLLLVAVLVFTALGCDGSGDPSLSGDASADSLPPIKADVGTDFKPVAVDAKPVVGTPSCTVPVSAVNFSRTASKFITVSNDVSVLCNNIDRQYPNQTRLDCGHPELNWGGHCVIVLGTGPKPDGSYEAVDMQLMMSAAVVSTTVACSPSGLFEGWVCTVTL
jgi:hypothetical protein